MNPEQANKFGRLSQKQQFYTAQDLFISKRSRDIQVMQDLIDKLITEFEQAKVSGRILKTPEQEQMMTAILELVGNMVEQNTQFVLKVEMVKDDVDDSMSQLSKALEEMLNSRAARLKTFQSLIEKRRGSKFQVAALTPEEKKEYDEVAAPLKRALNAQLRMIGLRVLYTFLSLENKWATEEIISSAGDISAAGKKMIEFGSKSSNEIQMMIGLTRAINDKIPTDWQKELERIK